MKRKKFLFFSCYFLRIFLISYFVISFMTLPFFFFFPSHYLFSIFFLSPPPLSLSFSLIFLSFSLFSKTQTYLETGNDLLRNTKCFLHDEHITLFQQYGDWIQSLPLMNLDLDQQLSMASQVWQESIQIEKMMKGMEQQRRVTDISDPSSISDQSKALLLGPKSGGSNKGAKSLDDPSHRLLDALIRDEKRYVHRIAAIRNLYLSELKKESLMHEEEQKCVFSNIQDLVNFHTHFLKTIEKAFGSSPLPRLSPLFLSFDEDALRFMAFYIEGIHNASAKFESLEKKRENIRVTCRLVQQRQAIEDLPELLNLPRNRMDRYIKFLSDYVDVLGENDPDFKFANELLRKLDEFQSGVKGNMRGAAIRRLETWTKSFTGINFVQDAENTQREVVKHGALEVKGVGEKEKNSANFVVLCSDLLVCGQKDHSTIQHVASLYLSEVVLGLSSDKQRFSLVGADGEWVFSCQDSRFV